MERYLGLFDSEGLLERAGWFLADDETHALEQVKNAEPDAAFYAVVPEIAWTERETGSVAA